MKDVLIVEDVVETRAWLTGIARAAFPECRVTEAASLRAGREAIDRGSHDLALIDIGLPDGCGLEIVRSLRRARSGTVCVITTVMSDDSQIVAALCSGAQGYLLKENPAEVLIGQLLQMADGVPPLSPSIARRIMEHFGRTGPAAAPEGALTRREEQVLALIARGMRNSEVAAALYLAESTVATHVKSIYRKLGIGSRAEASWEATRLGLLGARGRES